MSQFDLTEAAPPHRPCDALTEGSEGIDDEALHRFILGSDDRPRKLSTSEASKEVGDRFAQLLLLRGVFPRTAGEVLDALIDAVPADDPLRVHQFFLVGEGTQIPQLPGVPVDRNLRFLVTCGEGVGGPDIMISAFHPDQGTVEVMAWDTEFGGFNYYRTVGPSSAWVFAGNSRHALTGPTRDNGPFESHKSGHFLMKELKSPWVHWDSPKARVGLSVFLESKLAGHPWIREKRLAPGGAYTLEEDVAIPAMRRWTSARLDALQSGTSKETPMRVFEQILRSLTANLVSSDTSTVAATVGTQRDVDLPGTFFVDVDALTGVLGLEAPPPFFVSSAIYAKSLETFEVHLADGRGFSRPGDTHFAFVVPERAFEDTETLRQALDREILTRRLAACLLMVDFPNPVFSRKRERLFEYVPESHPGDGAELSLAIADAILNAPEAKQPGTAEHEFSERWAVGETFADSFNAMLRAFYAAVQRRLSDQAGFDAVMRLAEARRSDVHEMPIAESALLFAKTNIGPAERTMTADAAVEEG